MSATPEIPATAREVRVAAAPAGSSRPGLTVAQAPVPVPGPCQVLVRNRYFHVYAALRTLLAGRRAPSCGTSSRPASSPRTARSWPPDLVSNAGSRPG
jgi:hypothetical protein